MLIALFEPFGIDQKLNRGWIAGALLGLAILGKGFVPLVLFAPLLLIVRGKRLAIIGGMLMVAAPWHLLCWMRNGSAFWNDYFWKQHVARFLTPELEHVQPFWYYAPVLLAGLFPWTPLAGLLARGRTYEDVRVRLLAAWTAYALVFFSVSRNKLPGYLLPLLPVVAIVLAVGIEKAPGREWWLAACAALLVLVPLAGRILPRAILTGIRGVRIGFEPGGLIFAAAAALVWWLAWHNKIELAVVGVALAAGLGITYLKGVTLPALDRTVSVRPFWIANRSVLEGACLDSVRRAWEYGLDYYSSRELPVCPELGDYSLRISDIQDSLRLKPSSLEVLENK